MNGSIPETVSPQKDMLTALEGFANNSSVAVPHTADVKQLEVQGNGEQFVKALKYNNSGIRKAILGDSVSTGEDDKGVRAAKEVSIDVVNLRVKSIKNTIADAVRRDIYRLLTVVNFGADKVRLTPRCSLGDTERHD
jgi:phage gp29-like protein